MRKFTFLFLLALWLAGCNLPVANPQTPDLLQTSVAATFTAVFEPHIPLATPEPGVQFTPTPFPTMTLAFTNTPFATNTPEPAIGSLAGAIVAYPFGGTPRFTVVAYEQDPPYHYWYWVTAPGATYYSMDNYVTAGRYQVLAYSSDGPRGGCLTIVQVKKNETAVCDITDWLGSYRDKPSGVP